MQKQLTQGRPFTTLLRFTLPVVGGNLFQLFYTLADTVIVGRTLGANALAAVGATSIVSYFLNKHFTFRNTEKGSKVVGRFILNITVCYLLAYGLAKPVVTWLLSNTGWSQQIQGNLAMLGGSVLFVMLNYLGQRFFAFRER